MPKKTVEIEMDGAKKVIEVPEPLKRKCSIAQVLPIGVLQLLVSAPHNETVRNVLLAHLKVPVPEELKSYKDIQDWIEFNIEPPAVLIGKMKTAPGRENEMVQVLVQASESEFGSCNYSETIRGRGRVGVSREDIIEAAADCDDPEDFVSAIRDCIYEDGSAREHVPMNTVEGSRTYTDYEASDHEDFEVVIQGEGVEALKQALRQIDPDRYDELFG